MSGAKASKLEPLTDVQRIERRLFRLEVVVALWFLGTQGPAVATEVQEQALAMAAQVRGTLLAEVDDGQAHP